MFAIADSLGLEAGSRARATAQQIVGVTDLVSAGVELLQDIKAMFDGSPRDYLKSEKIITKLTADPEKRWAEWSHGKAINEKGVAGLLREYRIISKSVGPKEDRAKGYRKADFADAWERYLPPKEDTPASDHGNLPFTRTPPCNDYAFGEKSAVHQTPGEREKIDDSSSDINVVHGCTGKDPEINPSLDVLADSNPAADDDLDLLPPPDATCAECQLGDEYGVLEPRRADGRVQWLHPECRYLRLRRARNGGPRAADAMRAHKKASGR